MLPFLAKLPMHGFLIGFSVPFLLGLFFPLTIRVLIPSSTKPARWIQNCLPFSIFMLSAFPIAMGILTVTLVELKSVGGIDLFEATHYGSRSVLITALCALGVACAIGSYIVFNDFTSRPVAPYILRGERAAEAFKLEKELRDLMRVKRALPARRRRNRARSSSNATLGRNKKYQDLVQLKTVSETIKHGNLVVAAYLGISWMGTMCCIFYFWMIAVLVFSTHQLPEGAKNKLATVCILLMTWLPTRIHMDWYQNYFHNPDWLRESKGLWLAAGLAMATLVFVAVIAKPEAITSIFMGITTLVLALFTAAGKFKPQWLFAVANWLQSIPFIYFVAVYCMWVFLVGAFGMRILNGF